MADQQPSEAPAPDGQQPQAPPLPEGVTMSEYKHSYTELDGTKVAKRIIIYRILPSSPVYKSPLSEFTGTADSINQNSALSADGQPGSVPSGPPPDTIDPASMNDFKRAFLKRHNELREMHGSPPLIMSREMCNYAQEWADHIAHASIHEHRKDRKTYGENIFWKMSPNLQLTGAEPVDHWYNEVTLFDPSWYGVDPPRDSFKVSGHFTQLIWKETSRVGVGLALNGTSFYVVANYDPHGNFFSKYASNVCPPKDPAVYSKGASAVPDTPVSEPQVARAIQ